MLLETVINFCVLFTFCVLLYSFSYKNSIFHTATPVLHGIAVGIFSGLIGLVLIQTSISVSEEIILDTRFVVIVLSSVLGGPIAPLISGSIISFSRMGFGDFTQTAVMAGLNTFICSIFLSLLALKKQVTLKNATYYFIAISIETAIFLFFLAGFTWDKAWQSIYFLLFTNISFFVVLFIAKELEKHFKNVELVENLSETDFLTGLFNSRKFEKVSQDIIKNKKEVFSLMIIDIDYFKKINDTYGHLAGDAVLRELAVILKDFTITNGGSAYRYGGEEFFLLFPQRDGESSFQIAESLRLFVQNEFVITSGKQKVTITISIGISTFPSNGVGMDELYTCADRALYTAKRNGRNKVVHINQREEARKN